MVHDWSRDPFPRQQPFQQQCYPAGTRHPLFHRERYASDRQDSFQQDRYPIDGPDATRFQDQYDLHRRQPPMPQQIDEALRLHCGIAAKQYFVAAINEDGIPMTFFSPGLKLHDSAISHFFDASKFQQVMRKIDSGACPSLDDAFAFEDVMYDRQGALSRSRGLDKRRSSVFDDWGSPPRQGRKRQRARHPVAEEDEITMTMSSRRGIKVGDSEAVWSFYEQRFKNCQQTACKLIAKAWVKAVEPKKQSTHPYTGSDEKAPDWWPKPWGPTKDDKVRHKEPDHLYKRERVHLLAHILRLVVEPNAKQHPDIQKIGLNVDKLEEATNEALSAFFMDNETNAKKKPHLNEIFKMARQEARFKNGEIDDTTKVYVMAEDKMPDKYASDNDDGSLIKVEAEHHELQRSKPPATHCLIHAPTTTTTTTPTTTTTTPANGHALHGGPGSYMSDLPVRGASFHPPMIQTDLSPQQHSFVESGGMAVNEPAAVSAAGAPLSLDLVASPHHDSSRRPSVFSDYASPSGGSLYSQPWQQSSTGGSNAPSMYAYTGQQPTAQQPAPYVSQISPGQSFITSSFESSPRPEFDANGSGLFRSNDLASAAVGQQQQQQQQPPQQQPQPQQQQQQGYYLSGDGRGDLRVLSQVVDGGSKAAQSQQ
ncbi:hypothetical protein L249_2962 [Ophiocordyceps polyrhachis-furcata BCC 54312]|uniref:Subtelomeric hrmA-associated cluster protein AFUB-079030/YDR124W-like helical bundle domain-containing protein n=1 Tax=Ophiocordyceps polyrhachis-furcata BCC 54312 TaxID=1330021 RepID=A0A367LQL0_9HYPO|nr:hypothetical protein L249_2962 [Ophiocordyceps polyrhachis-furcata BCC 54312]